jgi:hypothetical protein
MADEKPSEIDPVGDQASKQTPEEPRTVGVVQDRADSVVALVIRKETAVDLLNALTIALGGVPGSPGLQGGLQGEESIELAGDPTLRSDI